MKEVSARGDSTRRGYVGKMSRTNKWIIRVTALVILALTILLVLLRCGYIGGNDSLEQAGIVIGAGVKEGRLESTAEGNEDAADDAAEGSNGKSAMSISINGRPTFADGNCEGNLNIVNPESNELHMLVEIRLNDNDEVIYNSGGIPPNHYIDNDKLTKVLKKGVHEATAYISLYDPDNPDTQFNSANFKLALIIKN